MDLFLTTEWFELKWILLLLYKLFNGIIHRMYFNKYYDDHFLETWYNNLNILRTEKIMNVLHLALAYPLIFWIWRTIVTFRKK